MNGKNADYATMPLPDLYDCLTASEAELFATKGRHVALLAEIGKRFTPNVRAAITLSGKPSGTFNTDLGSGFTAKAEVSKKVEWDQDKLRALAGAMTLEEVFHYFKIEFSVPEAIYKALPPGELKKKIDAARTTKYGDPKITIVPPEAK